MERDEQVAHHFPVFKSIDCMCKHDTRVTRVGDFTRLDDDRARAPTRRASHLARRDADDDDRACAPRRATRLCRPGFQ